MTTPIHRHRSARLQAPGTGRPHDPAHERTRLQLPALLLRAVHHARRALPGPPPGACEGEVQLHRLDLTTGESLQLTPRDRARDLVAAVVQRRGHGRAATTGAPSTSARDEVIFFDGQPVRAARSRRARPATCSGCRTTGWPSARTASRPTAAGSCTSTPTGRSTRALFDGRPGLRRRTGRGASECRDTRLAAFDLVTGEHRTLLVIASPIHHVLAYDERHLLFCHPTAEDGMLLTDIDGGWYTHLRTQDVHGGTDLPLPGHQPGRHVRGAQGHGSQAGGISTRSAARRTRSTCRPTSATSTPVATRTACCGSTRTRRRAATTCGSWRRTTRRAATSGALTGDWPAFGDIDAQKAHFHPQVVLDRRWLLLTAATRTTRPTRCSCWISRTSSPRRHPRRVAVP